MLTESAPDEPEVKESKDEKKDKDKSNESAKKDKNPPKSEKSAKKGKNPLKLDESTKKKKSDGPSNPSNDTNGNKKNSDSSTNPSEEKKKNDSPSNLSNKEKKKNDCLSDPSNDPNGNKKTSDNTSNPSSDPNEVGEVASIPPFNVTREWMKQMAMDHLFMGPKRMEYKLEELKAFLISAIKPMYELPTLLELEPPINVCGDIHGQLTDVKRIFFILGYPRDSHYLFLGDYVDRGFHSMEVITLLLVCRQLYPKNIFLLRGNHELAHINRSYGFLEEVKHRFEDDLPGAMSIYNLYNEIFSNMPLAGLIGEKILCMHGGISPKLKSLDDIRKITRPIIAARDLAQDILWSDPEAGVEGFKHNGLRQVSFFYGQKDVEDMCKTLDIELIIRAHQVVERGYQFFANQRVITIFSASRYQEDMWNYAGVVCIDKNLTYDIMQLKPSEFEEMMNKKQDDVTEDNGDDEGPPLISCTPMTKGDNKEEKSAKQTAAKGKTCEDPE